MSKAKQPIEHKADWKNHPVTFTLHFKSEADRDAFLGGLSDGWGENFCDLDWDYKISQSGESGPPLKEAGRAVVTPFYFDSEGAEF